ncbi:hypothetical protein Acr_17g0010110 [Actinidia rufa]|uniref:Uncharacterized protein n=1 Tax=Actinidia rufa TaxID=165716 RepID=A0A7J0G3T9_9ERIC|nr:hypothetical protein Acr_17g0010110 [Actinidia rufa]
MVNNICSDGRSSKKLKEKKVPQRGLGVAQLEKIRLDEQHQNKDTSSSSSLGVQRGPNFRHNPSFSSIPLPPPSPTTDLSLPNSVFRPASSIPTIDVLDPNTLPLLKPSNGGGGELAFPVISGKFPKLWNDEYNLEGENHRLDHHGFGFRSIENLHFESNPIWPSPNVIIQRTHQFQQQPPSSSMVNVSSGTSSSVINYQQMEPPSNQIFYGNTTTTKPIWPEEKMVGRKRPYPFSLDSPPGLPFPCKVPPTYFRPKSGLDESVSFNLEPSKPVFREGLASSSSLSELNSKKVAKQNGTLNGDFLTLALPTTAVPHHSSKYKNTSLCLPPHGHELPDSESLPCQGSVEDSIHWPGPSAFTQPKPLYSFFPLAKEQICQATTAVGSCSGDVGEKLDLNLKL